MKKLRLLICLCVTAPSIAQDAPASAESIRELMTLTKSQQLMDGMYEQLDGLMQQSTRDAMGGKELTAEQEKIMAEMRAKMIALFRDELGWAKLEPSFIDIYQKTLTQKEVDGMVAFYKTDAGKAVIEKMPQIVQLSIDLMMNVMQEIGPRVQELSNEMVEKLKATK